MNDRSRVYGALKGSREQRIPLAKFTRKERPRPAAG